MNLQHNSRAYANTFDQVDSKILIASTIDKFKLRKTMMVLRAIHHDVRFEIMNSLGVNQEEIIEKTVTDLVGELDMEQSVVSQHLAILRRANVVNTERQGKFICYSINRDRIEQIAKAVNEFTY